MAKKKAKKVLHFPSVARTEIRYLPSTMTIPLLLDYMAEEEIPLTAELIPGVEYDDDGYVVTLQWPVYREGDA